MKHKVTAHLVPQGERRETDNGLETDYKIAICDEQNIVKQSEMKEGDWFAWKSRDGHLELHQYHSDAGYGVKTMTWSDETKTSSTVLAWSGVCSEKIIAAYRLPNIPTISKEISQVIMENPSVYLEVEMIVDLDNPSEGYYTHYPSGKYHDDDPWIMKSRTTNPDKELNYTYATDAHGNIDVRVVEEKKSTSMFDDSPYGGLLDAVIDAAPVEDKAKNESKFAGFINGYNADTDLYKLIDEKAKKSIDDLDFTTSKEKISYYEGYKHGYTAASKDLFTKEDVKWTDKLVSLYQDYCHVSFCLDEDADIPEPAEWLSDYLTTKNK